MGRAADILERLRALGHNYDTGKQRFKADLGGERVTLYKPDGTPFECIAADMEQYIDKGFTTDPQTHVEAEPATETVIVHTQPEGDDLSALTKPQLADLAAKNGIDASGSKADILARLTAAQAGG